MKPSRILSIVALVLACVALTAAGASLILQLLDEESTQSTFPCEEFVDTLVDAGSYDFSVSSDEELLKNRTILITSSVNARFSREVISKLLTLNQRSSTEPIDLYLRTEGGWEADMFSIIDVMRSIKAPVNIHAIGEVHSAGLMMLVAATGKRLVYPNTVLGYHCLEDEEEEMYVDRYKNLFKQHAKLPKDWLDDHSGEFHYFTAEEALKYDAADEIVTEEGS